MPLVDLPFALPTAVAGIALTAIYAPNGWLGALARRRFGIKIAYPPLGIFIALVFIGLPFVVRTVQPVLRGPRQRGRGGRDDARRDAPQRCRAVILPALLPALISGFGLAFARAVGEYGSVIFIAGNMPMVRPRSRRC